MGRHFIVNIMGLFGTVSNKQVDDFAKSLAHELAKQCPPDPSGGGRPGVTPKRLISALEQIFGKALGFREQHGLGIYRKARLGNAFRWELADLGYGKEFIEDVTQRMIVHISRKAK